jgi:hypothetical protein
MSGRGPDPKDLRASLVDSGWSVAPPPAEAVEIRAPEDGELLPEESMSRRLPNYDDQSQAPAVTQIDADIQTRLKAMQRASLGDSHRPPLPPLPPPPLSRPAPPTLPPPPSPSVAPPPPSDAPLPSFRTPSGPDAEPAFAADSVPALRNSDSEPSEKTEVIPHGAVWPPSDPPALRSRELHAQPRQPDLRAPALPVLSLPAAPSVLSALKQRVRFAGGEVPLWSLLAPMVILLALGSGFVAAAVGRPDESAPDPATSASASSQAPAAVPSALASAVDGAPEAPATTQAPALPATSIDTEALEARHAEELTKDEALALASARRQREVARVALLRQKLTRDPGLFKDAATLTELRRAAEDPLTAPDALSAMAEAPGPLSADLLYEMWTGTVVRNGATELARSLVFSKEVRAKASPELAVALDLRIAETCQQNHELLPRVIEKGDRRSLALLAKLSRRFGCGANKRLDCYPCLRDDKAVDDAMTAIKKRREPKPFLGK